MTLAERLEEMVRTGQLTEEAAKQLGTAVRTLKPEKWMVRRSKDEPDT